MFDHVVGGHDSRVGGISWIRNRVKRIINNGDVGHSAGAPKRIGIRGFNRFVEDREGPSLIP